MNVWLILVLAVATVLTGTLWFRLHPFLVLMLAGLLVAAGTSEQNLRSHAQSLVQRGALDPIDVDGFVDTAAPKRLARAFGVTAGNIGVLIGLAGVIGGCLLSSGGAAAIVRLSVDWVGERRAGLGLAASSFVLGIPVFFDTVFFLMVPLARSLRRRTGGHYVFYILAIMAGGSIAHSLIPPTPGPLQVAEILGVDLLTLMLAGLSIGSLSSVFSLAAAWWLDQRVDVPLRPLAGESEPSTETDANRDVAEGPPVILALLPIVVPIALIATQTIADLAFESDRGGAANRWSGWIGFLGDRNVALGVGAAIAIGLLRWAPRSIDRRAVIGDSIAGAGVVILITSAGGAFGAMLGQSGIAERLASLGELVPGILLLPIAFGLTTAIRTVQGSATVAMITSAGILQGLVVSDLPFHPVYLALAIGGGSKPISWMNDSGFWVMCRMSGMTEGEGLRTITPLTVAMGLSTLFWTMLAASLFPLC